MLFNRIRPNSHFENAKPEIVRNVVKQMCERISGGENSDKLLSCNNYSCNDD